MIKKKDEGKSKFADTIAELDQEAQSPEAKKKAAAVVKQLVDDSPDSSERESSKDYPGHEGMKPVYSKTKVDANRKPIVLRWIKDKEHRTTFPVYLPDSLYADFSRVTGERGESMNAVINRLVRRYVSSGDAE